MDFARFKTIAVIPAIAYASFPHGASSEVTPPVSNVEMSSLANLSPSAVEWVSDNFDSVKLRTPATEWTRPMAKRFEELAILEAHNKISSPQLAELEELAKARRYLQYPRSPEEVLWEYKQRRITAELVSAVQRYAKFYESTDRKGA
jgi:hypothetical protein